MYLKFTIFFGCIVISKFLIATSINASSFGFNATDATSSIISAMNAGTDTVVVDYQASNWNVSPLNFFDIDGKVIIFEKGVILQAIPGAFNDIFACLLTFNFSSNIEILGYQATFKMNKVEYELLNDSEFRHNIFIRQSSNVTIKGLTLDGSGGDGILIGSEGDGINNNILIEDVKCINHYRQGMSITSAQNLIVKNCYFANTSGTLPEAGMDIEPYLPTQSIENVKIQNCTFENNGWAGLAVALLYLDSTSIPVSIEITDCYFKNNCRPETAYAKCELFINADNESPVKGNVLFERCFIDSSNYSAFYSRKTHDAFMTTFKDCVFQNVSQLQIPYNNPIFLEVPDYDNPSDYLGGYHFENVLISYPTDFNFFRVYGWPTLAGIKDITGHFTVVEPNNNPVLYSEVQDTINCGFTFTNQISLPITTITINALSNKGIECNQQSGIFSCDRVSLDISYPLGVSYSKFGTVDWGDDVHLMTGGIVIPSGLTFKTDTILPRIDNITEVPETVDLTISSNSLYVIGSPNTLTIEIDDCFTDVVNNNTNLTTIKVYPNPFFSSLEVIETVVDGHILITDQMGNKVYQMIAQSEQTHINTTNLIAGIYILHYRINNEQIAIKIAKF